MFSSGPPAGHRHAPFFRPTKWLGQGNALKNLALWLFGHPSRQAGTDAVRKAGSVLVRRGRSDHARRNQARILLVLRRSRRVFSLCSRTRACASARRAAVSSDRPAICLAGSAAPSGSRARAGRALELVAPAGLKASRLVFIGVGKNELKPRDLTKLGGIAMGKVPSAAREATFLCDLPGGPMAPAQVAHLALGASLRAYTFERYKTKRKEGEEPPVEAKIALAVADVARGAPGLAGAQRGRRRRGDCARPRERAGERALPGGIRRSHASVEEARRRGRSARRRRRCAGSA